MYLISLVLLVIIIICLFLIKETFVRNDKLDTTPAWYEYINANQEGREYIYSLNPEDLYINSFDNLKLHGLFINNQTNKTIICVHGYKAKDGLYDFGMSAKFLNSLGYNLLFVDNRAHGLSQGKYIGFGVLDSIDVNSWVDYLVANMNQETIILYGMSMGAATVLNTDSSPSDSSPCSSPDSSPCSSPVKAIIADCGFASGYDEVTYQIKKMYHLPSFPLVPISNILLKLLAKYSLKDKEAYKSIKNYKNNLLIIHGSRDHFVPTSDAYKIFDNATCKKKLLIIKDASHAKSYLKDTKLYEKTVREFLDEID